MSLKINDNVDYTIYRMQGLDDHLTPLWVSRNISNVAYNNWAQSITDLKSSHVINHLKDRYNAVLRIEETYDYEEVNWKYRQKYDWKIYFQNSEDMIAFILEWS